MSFSSDPSHCLFLDSDWACIPEIERCQTCCYGRQNRQSAFFTLWVSTDLFPALVPSTGPCTFVFFFLFDTFIVPLVLALAFYLFFVCVWFSCYPSSQLASFCFCLARPSQMNPLISFFFSASAFWYSSVSPFPPLSRLLCLVGSAPTTWPSERIRQYFGWAQRVCAGYKGVNDKLDRILADLFTSNIVLDGFSVPACPTEVEYQSMKQYTTD